ncbi:MAG: hypothetical protein RH946_17165 [Rhodospirillales bacterium]
MTEQNKSEMNSGPRPNRKLRNAILGIILAAAALMMYASIFVRLSENPLQ